MGWFKNLIARKAGKKIAREIGLQEGNVEKRAWFRSKTVWSGVLAVLVAGYNGVREPVGAQFGVTLPPIPEWAFALLGGLGIYGRATAQGPIGK